MVDLLKIVIFHGYACHNQMVIGLSLRFASWSAHRVRQLRNHPQASVIHMVALLQRIGKSSTNMRNWWEKYGKIKKYEDLNLPIGPNVYIFVILVIYSYIGLLKFGLKSVPKTPHLLNVSSIPRTEGSKFLWLLALFFSYAPLTFGTSWDFPHLHLN